MSTQRIFQNEQAIAQTRASFIKRCLAAIPVFFFSKGGPTEGQLAFRVFETQRIFQNELTPMRVRQIFNKIASIQRQLLFPMAGCTHIGLEISMAADWGLKEMYPPPLNFGVIVIVHAIRVNKGDLPEGYTWAPAATVPRIKLTV